MRILLIFATFILFAHDAFGLAVYNPCTTGYSQTACYQTCTSTTTQKKYCVPNGTYYTTNTYKCPSGWTASGSTCKRDADTTLLSNTRGYYYQTYGTCMGTVAGTTTNKCYSISTSGTASGAIECLTSLHGGGVINPSLPPVDNVQ